MTAMRRRLSYNGVGLAMYMGNNLDSDGEATDGGDTDSGDTEGAPPSHSRSVSAFVPAGEGETGTGASRVDDALPPLNDDDDNDLLEAPAFGLRFSPDKNITSDVQRDRPDSLSAGAWPREKVVNIDTDDVVR